MSDFMPNKNRQEAANMVHINKRLPHDDAIEFVVEATDTEEFFLWCEYSPQLMLNSRFHQATGGPYCTSVESWQNSGQKMLIAFFYAKINNRWTIFWKASGIFFDYNAAKDYMTTRFPRSKFTNAINFHNGHKPVSGPLEELMILTSGRTKSNPCF